MTIITTRPIVGITHMQVCVDPDATDADILAHCNRDNPAGTEYGWTTVIRDTTDARAPVACEETPGRVHILVEC